MGNTERLHYWLPRIICILAILFVSMFALDSFEPGMPLGRQITGFLIHLVPSYILIALLIVAWNWEFIGGILYTVFGSCFAVWVFIMNYRRTHENVGVAFLIAVMIAFPFILAGILFIMNHYRQKRKGLG